MQNKHSFFIPIMGTSFTIDTPLKVAKYGISSVMAIGDDHLCEDVRKLYCIKYNLPYEPIRTSEKDYRVRRLSSYLNLVDNLIKKQSREVKKAPFEPGSDITTYFELLPDDSLLKQKYLRMLETKDPQQKIELQEQLRKKVEPGDANVNIMTKVDKTEFDQKGNPRPDEYASGLTAFRGFAESSLESGMVFSAGFNRRLYAYVDKFNDFFPDETGYLKKRIILKVSDYRSAVIQGKFLAKKGIWISEYRIESGLNCGGHSFVSGCALLGPTLEEFAAKKENLNSMLQDICNEALGKKGKPLLHGNIKLALTVQGGVGTANEHNFLRRYFKVDQVGWGTPFLLVPEAVNVDEETLDLLLKSKKKDLYLSSISPLNVPFNTIYNTKSEQNKQENIEAGLPGSNCPKGFLAFNTEFTKKAICTASKIYQKLKIAQLKSLDLSKEEFAKSYQKVVDKVCLCEDLAAAFFLKNNISTQRKLSPAICPGPNMEFFSKISTLKEMIGHIYDKISVLNDNYRPHVFINELKLYIDYLAKEVQESLNNINPNQVKYFKNFADNLSQGIDYYKELIPKLVEETKKYRENIKLDLGKLKTELDKLIDTNKNILIESPSLA